MNRIQWHITNSEHTQSSLHLVVKCFRFTFFMFFIWFLPPPYSSVQSKPTSPQFIHFTLLCIYKIVCPHSLFVSMPFEFEFEFEFNFCLISFHSPFFRSSFILVVAIQVFCCRWTFVLSTSCCLFVYMGKMACAIIEIEIEMKMNICRSKK